MIPQLFFSDGTFNNTGTFTDTNAFADLINGNGTFNNSGTYNKQNNTLTTVSGGVDFNNTGIVNVNAGTLQVASAFTNQGTINVAADAVFHGNNADFANVGTIQGNGTIQTLANNDLVNSGVIHPGDNSIGHLTLDGDLSQTASGVINFELASLSNFDRMTVTDDVTLGGTIAVLNLGYVPVVGDSFVVATFDERLDDSKFSLPVVSTEFGSGVKFEAIYHEHDVTLAVTAVPEPESWAMLLAGLGLMGAVARRRRI